MDEIPQQQISKLSGFDQKAFIQIRLHELLSIIDKLSTNPLFYNEDYKTYNYKIIAQNLFSVLQTLFSKLISTEQREGKRARKKLKEILDLNVYSIRKDASHKLLTIFYRENFKKIEDGLFHFRCLIEKFMDSHGFNPSKDNPRSAVLKR